MINVTYREANFDRVIGPSHHYGGLSTGNLASTQHRHAVSSPRKAALQGLAKMKRVSDLGIPQAVLPPQKRPCLSFLREQGIEGTDQEVINGAKTLSPETLSIAYSSSAMWVANAATVSPSVDTSDGRLHLTPANLYSMPHRRLEAAETTALLKHLFSDDKQFVVHPPLASNQILSDEGAANHTRLSSSHGDPGIELFVYGRQGTSIPTKHFPARQTLEASQQIADQHGLAMDRRVFAQQSPVAIDAGAFHHDVVSVGNESVHLIHQHALRDQATVLAQLNEMQKGQLTQIEIAEDSLSLQEAVKTYLFNSQLLTREDGTMLFLAPIECERSSAAHSVIAQILSEDNPITQCEYVDLAESMKNGGGPACLRLRVPMSQQQRESIPKSIWMDDALYRRLCDCVQELYPDTLCLDDLRSPGFAKRCNEIRSALNGILQLPMN